MSKKTQAQAQAQAQTDIAVQVRQEIQGMTVLDLMLSAVPETTKTNEDGSVELLPVNVGEKAIEDPTLRKVTVTARTIEKFSKVSNVALSVELGQVNKELAKKEGFSTVKRYCALALPSLSDSRIMELYTVGRLFGNPETHKWKAPIPEQASITNLSAVAKAFCNTKKLDEATPEDIAERFSAFCRDYLDRLDLTDTLSELRKAIHEIQNPTLEVNATEVTEGEAQPEGQTEGEAQPETVEGEVVSDREEAQKAFDFLFKYFRGNSEAVEALSQALAYMPTEQEQPEQPEQEQPEA